jgi:pimeloyl-ACP methyl ester carboxylesterase
MSATQPSDITWDEHGKTVVVLVHGLWVGNWSWLYLGMVLRRAGLATAAFSYPTVNDTLHHNADALAHFVAGIDAERIHFVGHSLGGALICRMLTDRPQPRAGRVAMLATPLLDSLSGRRFASVAAGRALLGHTMMEWLATTPGRWDLPHPLGVIAGSLPLGLGQMVAPDLPRPHDGVVAVEETRMPGNSDHIVLPVCHTGMLASSAVARHLVAFLLHGRFDHDASHGTDA